MILYAVWAVIEVFTNTYFTGMQIPPVTGTETNIDSTDMQRNNSGWVMASGAVLGLVGLSVQYVYKGAPIVDSSMTATAAMILDQATVGRIDEEKLIMKAEEAATVAAAEVAKETAEDTVIEMLDPSAGAEEVPEEAPEAEAEEEAEEEAEAEAEAEAESEAVEEEAEEAPPEDMKKF